MNGFSIKQWRVARIAASLLFASVGLAQAHVYVVTDTNDTTSVTSLRGAVIAANQRGGENTIVLGEEFDPRRHGQKQAWTFNLTIPGQNEVAAQTGDLDITRGKLTIIGAARSVAIDGGALGDRVFHVWPGAHLELENVCVRGGYIAGPPPIGGGGIIIIGFGARSASKSVLGSEISTITNGGGGILNAGTLIMSRCSFESNSTAAYNGGAILNTGRAQMIDCNLAANAASGGNGGGVFNAGEMKLVGCDVQNNWTGAGGGGMYNDEPGILEMRDCVISSNWTADGVRIFDFGFNYIGGSGGGIYNVGTVRLHNSLITCNVCGNGGIETHASGGSGGGIFSSGELTMNHCTVGSNLAGTGGSPDGNGGNGGGIDNEGTLVMRFCTLNNNVAGTGGTIDRWINDNGGGGGSGGAIYSTSNLVMTCTTVSGNLGGMGGMGGVTFLPGDGYGIGGSGGAGGGVCSLGSLELTSCTIVSNAAGTGGTGGPTAALPSLGGTGGDGGNGGGIYFTSGNSSIRDSLIALNVAGNGGTGGQGYILVSDPSVFPPVVAPAQNGLTGSLGLGVDVFGSINSSGFNLIGKVDGSSGFVNGVGADQVGSIAAPIDPRIGPLEMNGGPTATHSLLPGSPAIDKGKSFGIHEDQRGRQRPYNYSGIPNAAGGDGSDIGAFELDARDRR